MTDPTEIGSPTAEVLTRAIEIEEALEKVLKEQAAQGTYARIPGAQAGHDATRARLHVLYELYEAASEEQKEPVTEPNHIVGWTETSPGTLFITRQDGSTAIMTDPDEIRGIKLRTQ